jgi:hypothetical protein
MGSGSCLPFFYIENAHLSKKPPTIFRLCRSTFFFFASGVTAADAASMYRAKQMEEGRPKKSGALTPPKLLPPNPTIYHHRR